MSVEVMFALSYLLASVVDVTSHTYCCCSFRLNRMLGEIRPRWFKYEKPKGKQSHETTYLEPNEWGVQIEERKRTERFHEGRGLESVGQGDWRGRKSSSVDTRLYLFRLWKARRGMADTSLPRASHLLDTGTSFHHQQRFLCLRASSWAD